MYHYLWNHCLTEIKLLGWQGAALTSLSISLLSYANDLSTTSRLSPRSLLALNCLYFIIAGGSLFIASISGILAGLRYHNPNIDKNRQRKDRKGVIFVSFSLSLMLLTMISGLIYMGNVLSIDNAGKVGTSQLPPGVIFPLVAVFVVLGTIMLFWFLR